jgi:hypothetical protein
MRNPAAIALDGMGSAQPGVERDKPLVVERGVSVKREADREDIARWLSARKSSAPVAGGGTTTQRKARNRTRNKRSDIAVAFRQAAAKMASAPGLLPSAATGVANTRIRATSRGRRRAAPRRLTEPHVRRRAGTRRDRRSSSMPPRWRSERHRVQPARCRHFLF